jgi:hypothetical protein
MSTWTTPRIWTITPKALLQARLFSFPQQTEARDLQVLAILRPMSVAVMNQSILPGTLSSKSF